MRWPEGCSQRPHADSENPDGSAHPFAWRSYASILYLNVDFEGGQIYFPGLKLAPPIQSGMLVFFPGNLSHLHGVRRITQGESVYGGFVLDLRPRIDRMAFQNNQRPRGPTQ